MGEYDYLLSSSKINIEKTLLTLGGMEMMEVKARVEALAALLDALMDTYAGYLVLVDEAVLPSIAGAQKAMRTMHAAMKRIESEISVTKYDIWDLDKQYDALQ